MKTIAAYSPWALNWALMAKNTLQNVCLKIGHLLRYRDSESETMHTAGVLERAGKTTGKFKNWYNFQSVEPNNIAGQTKSVDVSRFDDLQIEPAFTDVMKARMYW